MLAHLGCAVGAHSQGCTHRERTPIYFRGAQVARAPDPESDGRRSFRGPRASADARGLFSVARPVGFEPTTSGFEGRMGGAKGEALRVLVSDPGVSPEGEEMRCSPVSPGKKTRAGVSTASGAPRDRTGGDLLESALADALADASCAGRFDVVAQLARELEARRPAREPNVVSLSTKVRKR